ncbi:hypothetical protein [Nocardioides sp. GXQ0305]|uniref:hypothetical protein n=1 Tax=Nocardioides sp. GXQ0305 TaxID=3423912 RepID=UPI003D7D8D26
MRTGPARPVVVGLAVWAVLVAVATAYPLLTGWDVRTALDPVLPVPPLHAQWLPRVGPATVVALLLAAAALRWAVPLADRLPWRRLVVAAYGAGLVWALALAFVDGPEGGLRALGFGSEYLPTARETDDVTAMVREYVDRIPYSHPDNWPIHVAGHPPAAVLFYVALVRVGLGGTVAAGVVTVALAASIAPAVLVAVRRLGAEDAARRAAPFLVLSPPVIWYAVSADAMFAAVAAWGLAALAAAATATRTPALVGWSVVAGLLLGTCVMLSYGLPLLGPLAVAVLLLARSWRPLPIVGGVALLVVLGFAWWGFAWWEAFPVLRERYLDGIAEERPASYWIWGNLAALAVACGPALGAGTGMLVALGRRAARVPAGLATAAWLALLVADLSGMSKAEVERIWLPWMPWLLLVTALVPERWRRPLLAAQLATALLLQHLLNTTW